MNNRKQFAIKFSELLIRSLLYKYKKIPSAGFFANQFNLRAKGTTTITTETARKWLKGLVVPEIDRCIVLVDWLEIHPLDIFDHKIVPNKSADIHYLVEMKELIRTLEKQINGLRVTVDQCQKSIIKASEDSLPL